ncbi:DNA-cytosine methyltransferase [Microcystis phage MaeS]|nr:DNA-cytosine methyltransferase [Microcystis phage MaeS]
MGINTVSLFDGISCGRVALQRAGIEVDNYFASEINKQAIKVTQKNHPQTIQMGDVTKILDSDLDRLPQIDLFIGGSPCQDLSAYKLGTTGVEGLEGQKSNLFYQYERIWKYTKPKYFLLENVPMDKQWEDIITELLGVEPIMINSELVSAALRKRLYWTNIPFDGLPEDKGVLLKDIVVPSHLVPDKYWYNDRPYTYNGDDKKVQCTMEGKGWHRQMKEVYNLNSKCNTLLADGDGGHRTKKIYQDGRCRRLIPIEYERLQTLDDNYTEGISDSARYSAIGNGWTVDVIAHIFKGLDFSSR